MPSISKTKANALWRDLRSSFANYEKILVQIIEVRAWEPLGFATFEDAWRAKMTGFRLGSDGMRAAVTYQLLAEKKTDAEIVRLVGVGDQVVARLRSQRAAGVPAGMASTRVRAHDRVVPPSPVSMLHLRFEPGEVESFRVAARVAGVSVAKVATEAVRAAFDGLG